MKWNNSKHMQLIRQRAMDQMLFELIYPKKGKQRRSLAAVSFIIDYSMKKNWRYGWNACAAFTQSFPDGERLDANLEGGISIPV